MLRDYRAGSVMRSSGCSTFPRDSSAEGVNLSSNNSVAAISHRVAGWLRRLRGMKPTSNEKSAEKCAAEILFTGDLNIGITESLFFVTLESIPQSLSVRK